MMPGIGSMAAAMDPHWQDAQSYLQARNAGMLNQHVGNRRDWMAPYPSMQSMCQQMPFRGAAMMAELDGINHGRRADPRSNYSPQAARVAESRHGLVGYPGNHDHKRGGE